MAANHSWLIVCSMVALALMGSTGANHLVRRDLQRIRGGEVGDPKNASSTMYFQQLFGKAAADGSSNNGGQASVGNAPSTKNILHHHRSTNTATTTTTTTSKPPPALMASDPSKQNHPTSIQAVNATVHGGNLTSSETVNYYGYEPTGHSSTGWMHGYVPVMNVHTIDDGYPATGGGNGGGINKRHVHYPPVPMDVINADDDSQNDDGDYNDDDDPDDSDDYDGDGDGDRASDSPGASDGGGGGDGGGDGEVKDPRQIDAIIREVDDGISTQERDELEDDFDPSATFAIPSNIDPNTPGCKTVYKEVQNGPGKVKSIDNDDFDGDFAFRRRRRKREAVAKDGKDSSSKADDDDEEDDPHSAAATSASFVLARECHFSDEGGSPKNNRNKEHHPKAGASPLLNRPTAKKHQHPQLKSKPQKLQSKPPKRPKQPLMSGKKSGPGGKTTLNQATIGASINSPIVSAAAAASLLSSEPSAASAAGAPIPHQPTPTSGVGGSDQENGIASLKPKMPTDESRFVPINADPWRSARFSTGNFGDRSPARTSYYNQLSEYPDHQLNPPPPSAAYTLDDSNLSSSPPSSSSTMSLSGGDNTQHFHKYPYPHYHIYYNRPAVSVLDEQTASAIGGGFGSRDPVAPLAPLAPSIPKTSDSITDGDDTTEDDGIYDSPNAYFEFTNPNGGGGDDGGGSDAEGQDDDGEGGDEGGDGGGGGGGGDGGDNADGDDDEGDADDENVGLAASPAESVTRPTQTTPSAAAAASSNSATVVSGHQQLPSAQTSSTTTTTTTTTTTPTTINNNSRRARRVRRATRGYSRGYYAADRGALLPLPPSLSPSSKRRKSRKPSASSSPPGDDIYGWAVSGPNFYKSGKFENGDGKKKPKKYSYNYFQREEPDRTEERDDIYDGGDDGDGDEDGGEDGFSKSRPQGRASSRSMKFNVDPMPSRRSSSKSSLMADPGDYLINYGSGTFKEYDHEYDSDKDKRLKKKDKDNYDRRGGTGYGHGGGNHDDHQAENDDGQDDEDDGSYEGDNGDNHGGGDGHYQDDHGGHGGGDGGGDQGSYGDDFDF